VTRYAIALGSNLGDRLANLQEGVAGLRRLGVVTRISSVYQTAPVGGPEQGAFLNAVALLETDLSPPRLLAAVLDIEKAAGRVRVEHWGPRTLDIDLVAWEGGRFGDPSLEVPHPRAHQRAFVLCPLVEVWPEAVLADGNHAEIALESVDPSGVEMLEEQLI
jgi:2-amino-4-hydroxy-6-hydroxymethyldihydropteridine diphosphokinase